MDLVTGAIGSIISKLAELLKEEYKLQTGVKEQVVSLAHELEHVYAFLQKIDKVLPDQLDKQVKVWACEVREASHDMEDVLDAFLVGVKGPKPIKKNKLKRLQEKMGRLFSKSMARHGIANTIEEVNKKLKDIAERRRRYKLDDHVASLATPSSSIDPRIAMVHGTNVSMLVGIDEPKNAVIKMLCHDDLSAKKTKVVSLLGFGGLGKTTLAKATYDELKQKYECGAFVSVGRNPDVVKVSKDILFDLDKDKYKEIHSTQRGADFLIRELLEFLEDKRYLIIIDDVWETQTRKRITEALTRNNIGSRVIITTRNLEVATGEVYRLQPLSYDNSIKLFYARIFGGENKCPDNQRQKVSEVAHKILRKCGGVPLPIITMASLLVGKSMQEWFELCNCIGFRDKDKEQLDDTMWILSLSYYDLPSHLKTCLLYLSVFPEDYLIKKDALIWMWIAEGFVNGKPGIGLFEIGEGYFNDLINRSLIQPVEEEESGIVDECRVHDMILDLIRSLSREANFAIVLDNVEDTLFESNARRLALHQNRVVEDAPQDNHTDKARVRSFIAFSCSFGSRAVLRSFKLLRVLHLEGCPHIHFDEHVGDLIHLRYLVVIQSKFPGGIIKDLTSLQVLQIDPMDDDRGQFVKDLGNLDKMQRLELVGGFPIDEEAWNNEGLLPRGLRQLFVPHAVYSRLPSCIDPSHLPNLSHLSLRVRYLGRQGLKILGGLPQLCYLQLEMWDEATLTGTATHGYFPKLRSCLLPHSTVQFVVNEEDSSVSFTIWPTYNDAPTFCSKKKQDNCRVARAIMPVLESLHFRVNMACKRHRYKNLGLEYLASLHKVRVELVWWGAYANTVESVDVALRHATQAHPNQPTLEIKFYDKGYSYSLSDDEESGEGGGGGFIYG